MTEDERTDVVAAAMTSQGFKVENQKKTPGSSPAICRLTMRKEEEKATVQMALA
jgi:histidinol-phosphate/aromatic aminotransferase/cobyric acid decarboxylase-like protein